MNSDLQQMPLIVEHTSSNDDDFDHGVCSVCHPDMEETGGVAPALCGKVVPVSEGIVDDPTTILNPCSMCMHEWENHFH